MGSDSDMAVMAKAAATLEEFGIDYEMRIISAHREPEELVFWAKGAADRGIRVIIAGAGMAWRNRRSVFYCADAFRNSGCHSGC